MTLQQVLNIPATRVIIEYERYMELNGEYYGDSDFIKFCKRETGAVVEQNKLPEGWMPSRVEVSGIPLEVTKEYLPLFKKVYTGKEIRNPCYNKAYTGFCYMRWDSDSRNKMARGAVRMEMGWEPDFKLLGDQSWLTPEQLKFKIAEFSLYWKEKGEYRYRKTWNEKLKEYLDRRIL